MKKNKNTKEQWKVVIHMGVESIVYSSNKKNCLYTFEKAGRIMESSTHKTVTLDVGNGSYRISAPHILFVSMEKQ